MTEKQFKAKRHCTDGNCRNFILDKLNHRFVLMLHSWEDCKDVCDLLNEQHEQINTLRESRRELISANNEYRMRETELAHELSTLVDENEQLKNQNELLSDELEQCKAVIDYRWSEYLKKKEEQEND